MRLSVFVKNRISDPLKHFNFSYLDSFPDILFENFFYNRADICSLISKRVVQLGGYKYDRKTKTVPVFINYDKADDISDTIKYEDHFIDSSTLKYISKSNRTLNSEDVQNFIHANECGIDVHLFVRKNKDDKTSKEFYYLGRMTAIGTPKEFTMANTKSSAVEITWKMDTPVREDIYEYLMG